MAEYQQNPQPHIQPQAPIQPQQYPQQVPAQAYPQQAPAQAYQSPPVMDEKAPHGGPVQHQHQHQPAHNHAVGAKWAHGFWDCFKPIDLCCLTYWCPCVVFGKTYDREHGEKDPSGVGIMCLAWYGIAMIGCTPCLMCWNRGQTREKYGIQGDGGSDFCGACCCPCCMIVQEEKDSIVRQTGQDPVTKTAYQPVAPMSH